MHRRPAWYPECVRKTLPTPIIHHPSVSTHARASVRTLPKRLKSCFVVLLHVLWEMRLISFWETLAYSGCVFTTFLHRFRHLSIWTILKNRVGGSRTTSTNYRERAAFEVYHSLLFITKLHASAASVTVQLRTCWIPAIDLMWSPGSVPISLSSVLHGWAKIHTNELKPIFIPFPASFQWPWFIHIPCSSLMMSQ